MRPLEKRLNALEANDFVWPRLSYAVKVLSGETLEDACNRENIPSSVTGPNGQRIDTFIIFTCEDDE